MTISPDYQRDWPAYFRAAADKPARETLLRALEALGPGGGRTAVDVGCGEGRDARELLRRGWRVVALDSHEGGLEMLRASVDPAERDRLTVRRVAMEAIPSDRTLPAAATLCNASFALPFCDPAAFPALWSWIVALLAPGAVFSGQLFGDRDDWAKVRPASHHTRSEVEKLLLPFDVLWCDEVDKVGDDAMGGVKRHHVYHIVAKRKDPARNATP
ncbi:MAG: class I SAM-dependent methyltransferase [Phycisphaerales bacterium]